jgi:methylated-DNA-[protein]-cysteine S-methyltransferase
VKSMVTTMVKERREGSKQLITTPLGPFQAIWSDNGLLTFEFERSHNSDQNVACSTKSLPEQAQVLNQAVAQFFRTGEFEWDLDLLDWTGVSDFNQQVLRGCYQIPCGQTLTYGQLAAKVGSPQAARAVGLAMKRNRWPLLIPCHRVVGSNGKLVGYSGVGGLVTKRRLLDLELQFSGMALALE